MVSGKDVTEILFLCHFCLTQLTGLSTSPSLVSSCFIQLHRAPFVVTKSLPSPQLSALCVVHGSGGHGGFHWTKRQKMLDSVLIDTVEQRQRERNKGIPCHFVVLPISLSLSLFTILVPSPLRAVLWVTRVGTRFDKIDGRDPLRTGSCSRTRLVIPFFTSASAFYLYSLFTSLPCSLSLSLHQVSCFNMYLPLSCLAWVWTAGHTPHRSSDGGRRKSSFFCSTHLSAFLRPDAMLFYWPICLKACSWGFSFIVHDHSLLGLHLQKKK